jgi:hypothetical protein
MPLPVWKENSQGGKTLNVSEQNFSVWSKEHISGKVLQNTERMFKTAASGSP